MILVGFCIVLMLHWQLQTSTSLLNDSSNLNKVMKLLFCEWYIDKSVKQNCCFRNQRWDAVKSSQALKKVESNQPIRMQCFWPEYIKFQSELVQSSTFFWLVYWQTSRHATQMNWINTKVKLNVLFTWDLAKLKYCANLLFHSDQSECYIQASKKDSLILFFASLN